MQLIELQLSIYPNSQKFSATRVLSNNSGILTHSQLVPKRAVSNLAKLVN